MDRQETVYKLYKAYKHIEWLLAHIDMYQANEDGKELLDELVRYGSNIYTYPFEAERAYVSFRQHVWNNPFLYQTTPLELLGEKTEYCLFATSVDGYFVEYKEAENVYVLPLGFVKEVLGEKENLSLFQNEIAKMIREYHVQKGLLEQRFQSRLDKYQQDNVVLMEQRLGKTLVENNINSLTDLGKQFDSSNKTITVTMLILFAVYLICMGHTVNNRAMYIIAGGIFGAYILWFFWRMLRMRLYLRKIRRNAKAVNDYWQGYRNMAMLGINFDNIYSKKEKDSVKPARLVGQYSEIKSILEKENAQERKKVRIHHRYWDYFVIFIGAVLTAGMLLTGGIINFADSMGELPDGASQEQLSGTLQGEEEPETAAAGPFDSNGFIFADSDSRYLTDSEVYALREVEGYEFQDLLGFARNEIYARHGYPFDPEGKYYPYYMQYSWYSDISHQTVEEGNLNDYEKANINLIVRIESEYGY